MRVALAKALLRWSLRDLEAQIGHHFNRSLSMKIDAVHVALEALG